MTILVTGGAGFIGANFVLNWHESSKEPIVVLDCLTDVANLSSLSAVASSDRFFFERGSITDQPFVAETLARYQPRALLNFAAESHVDRSIRNPQLFVHTNIYGTFALLEATRAYHSTLRKDDAATFRFLHVSTDEVYGSLGLQQSGFTETTQFSPNSPYSATKAASDHLVRAWFQTYGLPVLTTNCSNNYGPFQFPEKLIPLTICRALAGKSLPIYGDGKHSRDWLYVDDHCDAIRVVLERGQIGQTYNVGGGSEMPNLDVVRSICFLLDRVRPKRDGTSYQTQIEFVDDRLGHDRRYAVDTSKIRKTLGWRPAESFVSGLEKTVGWYLDNLAWVQDIQSGKYMTEQQRQSVSSRPTNLHCIPLR